METVDSDSGSVAPTRVLVVDDDELVREITVVTLIEFGLIAEGCADGNTALQALARGSTDLVLTDIRMPEMDGLSLLKIVQKQHPSIPVLLMTAFEDVAVSIDSTRLGAAGLVSKPCQAESLVDLIREIMDSIHGIKPKDSDFARIAINDFISGKMLPYNIYVRMAKDRYVRVASKGVDLDMERLRAYQSRGVQFLHLKKRDFQNYLRTNVLLMQRVVTGKKVTADKKQRFLKHAGDVILEHCSFIGIDEAVLSGAKEFLINSLELIAEEDSIVDTLALLNDHADFLYAHSLGVSLMCTIIAQELKWDSASTTFKLGLAGLFHDIGKKEIDRAIISKPRHLLFPAEKTLLETHPTRGLEILRAMGLFPDEVLQAVHQHHEEPGGLGYPGHLRGLHIVPMAQIVAVANTFCGYTIKNPNHPKGMSSKDAVQQMTQFNSKSLSPTYFGALKKICG